MAVFLLMRNKKTVRSEKSDRTVLVLDNGDGINSLYDYTAAI